MERTPITESGKRHAELVQAVERRSRMALAAQRSRLDLLTTIDRQLTRAALKSTTARHPNAER